MPLIHVMYIIKDILTRLRCGRLRFVHAVPDAAGAAATRWQRADSPVLIGMAYSPLQRYSTNYASASCTVNTEYAKDILSRKPHGRGTKQAHSE